MDASSERDVRKLVRFFENLGASSPDTKKSVSLSFENSDGKGYSATDGSDVFQMAGGTADKGLCRRRIELEKSISEKFREGALKAISEKLREYAWSIDKPTVGHPPFKIFEYGEPEKSISEKLKGRGQSIDKPTVGHPSFGIYDYGEEIQFGPYNEDNSKVNSKTVMYTTAGYSTMSGEQLVAPVDIVDIGEEIPISVPCDECSKEHPLCSDCPYVPCTVCYQLDHPAVYCPYLRHIPQGAAFDRVHYELVCSCGNLFNEDKWVCTCCPWKMPKLEGKYCCICHSFMDHSSYECPKDEVLAAEYRQTREYMLSGAFSCV